jgi:cytidylate kinase
MKIILIGLPGSGRKTLVNELSKHYNIDFYDDFFDGEYDLESKSDIKIHTMFQNTNSNFWKQRDVFDEKIFVIVMTKVFKESDDIRYSEFFGIDIKYIYEQNIFSDDKIDESKSEENKSNFRTLYYKYNFEDLKLKIEELFAFNINMEEFFYKSLLDFKKIYPQFDIPNEIKFFPSN